MKKNVNVFIAVLLVAVLCGGVIWLQTADEEKLGWNIHDSYGDTPSYSGGAAYTNATFAGPSAGEGGVMPLSSSSALRARTSYSYAGAYSGASSSPIAYSQSPIANSLTTSAPSGAGLYTTSSKTFNSYGGGGNGGAMSYSQSSISNSQSPIANSQSPIANLQSPIAYSTARRGEMSGGAGVNPAMMAAENPMVAMASAANAANAGMNTSFYGGIYATADYSSADYGQYSGMFGGSSRMGIRGRQNLGNVEDTWLNWLALNGDTYGKFDEGTKTWYLDINALRSAWEDFCATWNEGMGKKPTWDEWLAWFMGSEGNPYEWSDGSNSSFYTYLPVGNILPLLLFALVYVVILFLKRNKMIQL